MQQRLKLSDLKSKEKRTRRLRRNQKNSVHPNLVECL